MVIEQIKKQINQIDFDLKKKFDQVIIEEKSDKSGYYFEILARVNTDLNEGVKSYPIKIKIFKNDMIYDNIKWYYQSDTFNESSKWILRESNINMVSNDIYNIIFSGKMNENYFKNIQSVDEIINENNNIIITETLENKIKKVAFNYGINIIESVESEGDLIFIHEGEIKMSDKFIIESKIKLLDEVNYIIFEDDKFKIKIKDKL